MEKKPKNGRRDTTEPKKHTNTLRKKISRRILLDVIVFEIAFFK